MAAIKFSYYLKTTLTGPKTFCQFKAPENQRVKLIAIEAMPLGNTPASAPLEFDVCLQDGEGTATNDSSTLAKRAPVAAHGIQTTVRKTFTVEPTTSTRKDGFTLHRQGARTWVPTDGPIIIEGNTWCGIRYLTATSMEIGIGVVLEE